MNAHHAASDILKTLGADPATMSSSSEIDEFPITTTQLINVIDELYGRNLLNQQCEKHQEPCLPADSLPVQALDGWYDKTAEHTLRDLLHDPSVNIFSLKRILYNLATEDQKYMAIALHIKQRGGQLVVMDGCHRFVIYRALGFDQPVPIQI
ncbi:hypothetical protein EQG49_12385 [Periweissella cryptocerci]|uniref:ParB/Sulfiredoxin domain-containing protein n=1 Tax=Periweissella cryptocerci TaxID=2506420 RepID=A0A4P6YWL6_9LACO|nr:hypothetical protein [Periweissella cryptocerci]QBO37196.1 hypothetical protein EQG49_12385 [Periweissella cryptocerci]